MIVRKIAAVLMCLLFAATCWGLRPKEAQKAVEEADRIEAEILETLQQDSTWEPSVFEEKLEPCLTVIERYRLKGVIPVLIEHIEYSDKELGIEWEPVAISRKHPAVGALISIGLPAVPGLLSYLSQVDIGSRDWGRKQVLAMYSMQKIYEQAGYGRELLKRTIELRAEESSGEKKERLLKTLEHPAMKLGE